MKITREYIQAKNGLLLNIGILVLAVVITGTWYISISGGVSRDLTELKANSEIAKNVLDLGIVAMDNESIETTGASWVRAKKIQQLQKLFPESRSYVFSEDPEETLRLQNLTLSLVEKPKNEDDDYATWLRESVTPEMNRSLQHSQENFWEVLPVFVSVDPDLEHTKDIVGKVDLKSIVQLVEDDLFATQDIQNVQWALGIRNVVFDDINPELGYYDISARVNEIPSARIIELLEYLGTLGWIQLTQEWDNGLVWIQHLASIPARVNAKSQYNSVWRSALSNPLLTIPSIVIQPSGDLLRDSIAPTLDPYVSLSPRSRFRNWDMVITLRFYVRGASDDHFQILEAQLSEILSWAEPYKPTGLDAQEDNQRWSLENRVKNALLVDCGECFEQQQLKQVRSDLEALTTVYESFQESLVWKDPPKPTDRIQTTMHLLDSFTNLQNKIHKIIQKLNP